MYRCRDHLECPGNVRAGTCAANREGVGCASCIASTVPNSDTGACDDCATGWVPFVTVILFGLGMLLALSAFAVVDISKTSLRSLTIGICVGQLVVAVQALTVLSSIEVDWVEPITSLLAVVSVLTFEVEVLNISCMMAQSNIIGLFVIKLLLFPAMGVCLIQVMFLLKLHPRLKDCMTINSMFNSVGLLFLMLYMTLSLLALSPFQCLESPNGTLSMSSNPTVLCDTSSQHVIMAILGVCGLLVYSVFSLAWVAWVTLQCPAMVASGGGSVVIKKYRFLFQRFSNTCHWYAPFFLIRNFLLALLPVVFANHGHRQIHAFVIILLFTGFPQAMLQPYRGLAPNVLEALVASCLTMLLLGAGFSLGAENREVVTNDLQIFFGIFIALGCLGFSITVCRQVYLRFFPDPRYFAFLSHHKGGCSVGARVMKIELERKLGKKCFLDSDNLDSLEEPCCASALKRDAVEAVVRRRDRGGEEESITCETCGA